MNAISIVLVAASLAGSPVQKDDVVRTCATREAYRQFDLARFERNYAGSLRFPVDAVKECALRDLVLIKLAQPEVWSETLYDLVCDLADDGASPGVRYKAALAKLVFEQPEMFTAEGQTEYLNDEEVFAAIAGRLRETVLAIVIR